MTQEASGDSVVVWRLELEDGTGPYYSGAYVVWDRFTGAEAAHRPMASFPAGHDRYDAEYRYGFKTVAALYQWFDDTAERRKLRMLGYRLATYMVPREDVVHDRRGTQLHFHSADASRVAMEELAS